MNRFDCLTFLAPLISDELIVTSLSGQRVEWEHLSKHEGNLLVGSMGTALSVGMGLALALPHRKVIALESDGSTLLSLFNLATLGNLHPHNLAVFVFDNEVYSGTRISEPTATSGNTDLAGVARSCGISNAITLHDLEEFKLKASSAIHDRSLSFIVSKIEETEVHRQIERTNLDPLENKYRFVRYLERTEKKTILLGRG